MNRPERAWLGVGGLVSVVVHLAGATAIVALPPPEPDAADLARIPEPEDDAHPLRLGLRDADRVSIQWLGVRTPTPEHVAPLESEQEQADLTTDPAGGAAALAPSPDQPAPTQTTANEPEPTEPTSTATTPSEGDPELPEPALPEPELTQPEPREPQPSEPERADPERSDEVLELLEPEPRPREPARPPEQPPAAQAPTTQAPTTQAPATRPDPGQGAVAGPGSGQMPGAQSERESVAVAYERTLEVRDWTTPIVGEGLELITVRPRWPLHFMGGRLTRPAVVEIAFTPEPGSGEGTATVRRAEFWRETLPDRRVVEHSSGDGYVDSVVLNAIYRWRARGERIEALGPGEELVIRMRLFTVR